KDRRDGAGGAWNPDLSSDAPGAAPTASVADANPPGGADVGPPPARAHDGVDELPDLLDRAHPPGAQVVVECPVGPVHPQALRIAWPSRRLSARHRACTPNPPFLTAGHASGHGAGS